MILGFDSKLLKIAVHDICKSLTCLFNLLIKLGEIPKDWKLARITPIYKGSGSRFEENNYRPISVICHISKILEREIHGQFMSYLIQHNFVSIDQSAYMKYHSTHTCLHKVVDDWLENIDEGLITGLCLLDIRKCFDTIDHTLLLEKLNRYGVKGVELHWFKSYLNNRSQKVVCNNETSNTLDTDIGVPQGSILGPILFLVFINDLSQNIKSGQCNLYADDTLLYTSSKTIAEVADSLQKCLNEALIWYENNNLCLNADKSKVMIISSNRNREASSLTSLNLDLDGIPLQTTNSAKYLGIFIDNHLTWERQFSHICQLLGAKISRLRRLRKSVPSHILNTICRTCLFPTFDYVCSVWGNAKVQHKRKVQRLQNYAARIVTNNFDYVNTRGEDLVRGLKWQTFNDRVNYFTALLMFKCIHGLAPHYLSDHIVMACEAHDKHTRLTNSFDVVVPSTQTSIYQQSFMYNGAKTWNNLPEIVKESPNVSIFKYRYKKHVLT